MVATTTNTRFLIYLHVNRWPVNFRPLLSCSAFVVCLFLIRSYCVRPWPISWSLKDSDSHYYKVSTVNTRIRFFFKDDLNKIVDKHKECYIVVTETSNGIAQHLENSSYHAIGNNTLRQKRMILAIAIRKDDIFKYKSYTTVLVS